MRINVVKTKVMGIAEERTAANGIKPEKIETLKYFVSIIAWNESCADYYI